VEYHETQGNLFGYIDLCFLALHLNLDIFVFNSDTSSLSPSVPAFEDILDGRLKDQMKELNEIVLKSNKILHDKSFKQANSLWAINLMTYLSHLDY
jgi:hypothetical protein